MKSSMLHISIYIRSAEGCRSTLLPTIYLCSVVGCLASPDRPSFVHCRGIFIFLPSPPLLSLQSSDSSVYNSRREFRIPLDEHNQWNTMMLLTQRPHFASRCLSLASTTLAACVPSTNCSPTTTSPMKPAYTVRPGVRLVDVCVCPLEVLFGRGRCCRMNSKEREAHSTHPTFGVGGNDGCRARPVVEALR